MQGNFYQSIQSIFKGHTAYISECEFIGSNSIVTASGDMTCALWDLDKRYQVSRFRGAFRRCFVFEHIPAKYP